MAIAWTDEQQKVISMSGRNILVSAAAGSGKTAVLVERILQKMLDREHPVDIDRLLIVTFTRAAAGEMRERLTSAVEAQLELEPDNEHLQRQQTLIHNAQITTIDGFCSYVIRNYFHTIDLDPGFRVANEGELKLLKQDVVKDLLEANFEENTPAFLNFAEVFAYGKDDDELGEKILTLFDSAMSNPWPKEWLEQCAVPYRVETFEELQKTSWMEILWEDAMQTAVQADALLQQMEQLASGSDGAVVYGGVLPADTEICDGLRAAIRQREFDSVVQQLAQRKFSRLPGKKDPNASEAKKARFKSCRDQMKELWKKLQEQYFTVDSEGIMEQIAVCREPVEELVRLTLDFMEAFTAKKREKNLVDFTDMEHFALRILVRKDGDDLVYTPAAEEFADRFEEILIDEYQDSNLVQETLLQAVSRMRRGQNNLFMVGDVKQSIYRFRMARPELFMEKYDTYTKEESDCTRIDLHMNFRSRKVVLDSVNAIFRQIMGRDLGNVEYDAEAALNYGADYPADETGFTDTEVLILDSQAEEEADSGAAPSGEAAEDSGNGAPAAASIPAEGSAQELEARMIGRRILQMVGREQVVDKKTGTYRPTEFRDCVILLRTMSGWAEPFVRVLMDMGIPAYAASRTGYFSTLEVSTILNYLRICDNPLQDIPFTGSLLSPIGGCTAKELAVLKTEEADTDTMYRCARQYAEHGRDRALAEKLCNFFAVYDDIRERIPYTPIHELIRAILDATHYDTYAAAMPGGEQRYANLQMLSEKAMEYEQTSYRGLFNFLRYIESLQKYEVDFGEMSTISETENTVRIMSIHKSKGLEFPVVFAAGMGKSFNMMDVNASLVIHQDLGLGVSGIDPVRRIRFPVLIRQVIRRQNRLDGLGEELRVLYVALTRAKEKLILTGTMKDLEKRQAAGETDDRNREERLPFGLRSGAKCFWDWIYPSLQYVQDQGVPLHVRYCTAAQLTQDAVWDEMSTGERRAVITRLDPEQIYDADLRKQLTEAFSYEYPKAWLQDIPGKLSVSQLKAAYRDEQEEESVELYPDNEVRPIIPSFMRTETEAQGLRGAARGTAYHRVMELLDYSRVDSEEAIREQMEEMKQAQKIDEETAAAVRPQSILWFAGSSLGMRMKFAFERKQLFREQPFVMSVPAGVRNPEWGDEAEILVQGIIDAYFMEKDGIILVDYKTDRADPEHPEALVDTYRVQLAYYKDALERVMEAPVKEVYIYSFSLGKSLPVTFTDAADEES